ncbi:MAG: hypothetical protein ACI4UM_09540 [Succinivibrio sp.]
MHHSKYQQRSLLILLPLGLLAITSFALDRRIPIGIDFVMQNILLDVFRTMLPGFLALAIAFMIPTFNRYLQLFSVGFNYSLLCCISMLYYPKFFSQPTAWVISSLAATMFLLPSNDIDQDSERTSIGSVLIKVIGVVIVPALLLLSFVVVIKNIEHSIVITFSTVFVNSILSCLFVPIYELMLTLGFSSLLNSLVSLQSESETVHAMLNSLILTNLFVLPALMLTRSFFARSYSRLFLVFLALITCLTSKIGACVSVELSILMLFFPGTMIVLCTTSVILFFICLYLNIQTFTNFYLLYQPDLVLKSLAFLRLTTSHYISIILAVVIPVILQIALTKVNSINYLKNKLKLKIRTGGLPISEITDPDLLLIAILKNIGGKSNIEDVTVSGDLLMIKVFSFKNILMRQLSLIGKRKTTIARNSRTICIAPPKNCLNTLYTRLKNIVSDSKNYTQSNISLSEPFDIHKFASNNTGALNRE